MGSQRQEKVYVASKMLEINGLKYISTPRTLNKRGGGCAIVANVRKFSLEKIEVPIPKNLEVVYGILGIFPLKDF